MLWKRILPPILMFLMAFGSLAATAGAARTRGDGRYQPTPPRLGFIDGNVSFWRPGADDWVRAQVNTALAAGDSLYAGDGANLEIQIGPRAFVRAAADTEIGLESLESDYMQFRVTGGHAALDLKRLRSGQVVEVDTPNGAFTIDRAGYYHVHVDEGTTVFSVRRGGAATVTAAGGESTDLEENQQVVLEGTDIARVVVGAAPDLDQWDRWNYDRTNQYGEAPRSAQYLPPDVTGADDLDRYGDWRDTPDYGHVWVPRDVASDWAPYSTGRWVYDPYYEWTWVDQAPWGWAPYHYGRWAHTGGYWGWAPGPVVVAPVYSPALVAFFGSPGGVSVSVGLPFVSWVALGFGEPVIPWWGERGFVGTPYWGGWGGRRVVNNVVISNTTIVNVRNINNFSNAGVNNAVVAINRDQFGRGQAQHVRLAADRVRLLQPVRGDLQVKPVAASLALSETRGHRPPDKFRARSVVATRQPQDATKQLERKGLRVAPEANRPAPRIVNLRRGGSQAVSPGERSRPGEKGRGAQDAVQQPPAPPGRGRPDEAGTKPRRQGQPPRDAARPQPGERAVPPSVGGEHRPSSSAGEAERGAPPPPPQGEQPRSRRQRPGVEVGTPPPPLPQGGDRKQPAASGPRERSVPDGKQDRPGHPQRAVPPSVGGEHRPSSSAGKAERGAPPPPQGEQPRSRRQRPGVEVGTPPPPAPRGEGQDKQPAASSPRRQSGPNGKRDPGTGTMNERAAPPPVRGGGGDSGHSDRSRGRVPPPSVQSPANPPARAEKPQRQPAASQPPVVERPAAPPRNAPQPGGQGGNQKNRKDQKDQKKDQTGEPQTFAPAGSFTRA